MKSTKTKRYVVEKKFKERYMKIQLRSSSQRSTKLLFESGTSQGRTQGGGGGGGGGSGGSGEPPFFQINYIHSMTWHACLACKQLLLSKIPSKSSNIH